MDKYLTFAGTQPVFLGDIDFMQDAVKQAVLLLIRSIANDSGAAPNVILQGLGFSNPDAEHISWTDGVVALNGEILPIASATITGQPTDALYFHVVSTTSGSRTFKDGQTHDCFETRVAMIDTDSEDGIAVASVPRLGQRLIDVELTSTNINSDNITQGRLARKDAIWSMEIALMLSAGDNSIEGSVTFGQAQGVTQEIANSIRNMDVLCPVVVTAPRPGDNAYGFVCCQIRPSLGATITLTFTGASQITLVSPSTAKIALVLPF